MVTNIWSAILQLDIRQAPQAVEAAHRTQLSRSLTSCVQVTGTWEGTVLLFCTFDLAARIAAIMFDVPAEELSSEEIEDVMGELGNMTAGNVKKLFSGPCQISLPAVVDGVDYRLLVPGTRDLCKILFECQGQPVLVTVLEKDTAANGSGRSLPQHAPR